MIPDIGANYAKSNLWICFCCGERIKYLDMSVDEAVKFIISLGTVDDIVYKIKAKKQLKHKEKYMKPNKYRSVYAKDLTKDREGESVDLSGWHRVRDHGGVIFIDLRDHTGLTQIVCNPDQTDVFQAAERYRAEYDSGSWPVACAS